MVRVVEAQRGESHGPPSGTVGIGRQSSPHASLQATGRKTGKAMRQTPWRKAQAAKLTAMSPAERKEYEAAGSEADLSLRLAELVYDARAGAGLSQTELAERMGTRQPVISAIEGGGQVPTVAMLERVARATGQRLRIDMLEDTS